MSHSGALSFYTEQVANDSFITLSVCQSYSIVALFGGTEPYYSTNLIAFTAHSSNGKEITLDMEITIQAWAKILHARSKNKTIANTWAVDKEGNPTTDQFEVNTLLPIAGPKGYGLAMMVDVLSSVLLGLPFGNKVSSMYEDLKGNLLNPKVV